LACLKDLRIRIGMPSTDPSTGAASPTPKTVRRRAKTRPALIDAGLRLLAAGPVDRLSVDEIVEAANVAKGSFFYHFADKQSFAREIAGAVRAEIEATISEVNRDVADPAHRVARGVGQFLRFAINDPDKAKIVLSADRQAADPSHALNAGLRADLELGVRQGRFDVKDVDAAMLNLIGVTQLLISKVLFDRLDIIQSRALFRSVLGFAFRGLGLSTSEADAVLDGVSAELLHE
jgi:AcrR family transcriptional regulator